MDDEKSLNPRDRDPWYGYDNWRLGRVRVTRRTQRLLQVRPVLAPSICLLIGIVLVAGGLGVGGIMADDSRANWIPAAMFGFGAAGLILGVSGLISALVVYLTTGRRGSESHASTGTEDADGERRQP